MQYSFRTHRISGGIGADDRYWEALEEGVFELPRCADCGRWVWPAHFRCGQCGGWELDWEPVDPVGAVYAWTRCWYTFDRTTERSPDLPYVVVLAEIPAAGGARVTGVLDGAEEHLRIGSPVRGKIDAPSAKAKGYATIRWELTGD
ncbi:MULTISPECIES: Zn-ribbon domain-containing OB-fold protein [Mycobacterium]|uniref:ChsH2 rubredoxin-like zinc ribbon domain-containing protein n=1 Tax=Mycobacterium kiyosense TaxID=2871094 RepID=A0A9P3Q2Z1_9MYCO|nr:MULTISPECIES: zinc ribbon domain-containing protein [Mycobacterium]BDB44087.1 hypothetical protein IWGMT90018_45330 [Mycobacterium kiyosense]BDE15622.1 hypothetical protein MKCMC460_44820 [Mycobacterium sp. 20KCMC460]GLB80955.1 hypothetical protein SRL2020028_02110 [Mycobacterium kiyosense]GLB87285.1 hypothetical protein SRL2020130_01020 [Mycobacterium kiyosense]GLB93435.1 hypothetical protein SRL2020226_02110 [Mycobacterium kiyosense]